MVEPADHERHTAQAVVAAGGDVSLDVFLLECSVRNSRLQSGHPEVVLVAFHQVVRDH